MLFVLAENDGAIPWANFLLKIVQVISTITNSIINNEVLMTLFCASLLITGVSVFRRIKKASRA